MGTWNYTLNDKFAEVHGADAAASFVNVLGEVAGAVRPGDREGAQKLLSDGLGRAGLNLPEQSVEQLAENLTLAEHDRVVVSDDGGQQLAEFALPGSVGTTEAEAAQHEAPDENVRPLYS